MPKAFPLADPKEVAMKVGDILRKKTARVATVRMNETVAIAAQLMRASNISALVVKDVVRTEGNTAAGMFTERDVVRAIAEHGAAGVNMKVSQLISVQQLVSCSSSDTLEHVRHLNHRGCSVTPAQIKTHTPALSQMSPQPTAISIA